MVQFDQSMVQFDQSVLTDWSVSIALGHLDQISRLREVFQKELRLVYFHAVRQSYLESISCYFPMISGLLHPVYHGMKSKYDPGENLPSSTGYIPDSKWPWHMACWNGTFCLMRATSQSIFLEWLNLSAKDATLGENWGIASWGRCSSMEFIHLHI